MESYLRKLLVLTTEQRAERGRSQDGSVEGVVAWQSWTMGFACGALDALAAADLLSVVDQNAWRSRFDAAIYQNEDRS